MSIQAQQIDEAHRAYRMAIGTVHESQAYAHLCVVVAIVKERSRR